MPVALTCHASSGRLPIAGPAAAHWRAAHWRDDGDAVEERPGDFSARLQRRAGSIGRQFEQQRRRLATRITGAILAMILLACWTSPHSLGFGDGNPAQAATLAPGGQLTVEPMPFEKPGESFPGSAYYYVAPADAPDRLQAAPKELASGLLGDDARNPAASGAITPEDPGPSAQPLLQTANPIDRTRALTCLTTAIYYEAASEPDDGQRAVAQVVLNRLAHPGFPKTVCGVVYEGSERATGCQFTFSCDGSLSRPPAPFFWRRAEAVARAALAGFVFTPIGLATHYHTFAVHPPWADSLDFIGQIGAHRFYRMTGPAGAPTAFHFAYAGGEPLPLPHLRSPAPSAPDASPDPLAIERAYADRLRAAHGDPQETSLIMTNATAARPPYSTDALRRGGDAAFRMPEPTADGGVKPQYRNSGRWIADPQ